MPIVLTFINKILNESIKNGQIPDILKLVDITQVKRKNVSILPALSAFFERSLYDQIYKNVDRFLSKYQRG